MPLLLIQILFAVPFLAVLWCIGREVYRWWAQRRANRASFAAQMEAFHREADERRDQRFARRLAAAEREAEAIRALGPASLQRAGYDSVRHQFSHGRDYGFGRSAVLEFPAKGGGLRFVEMAAQGPDLPECP